MKLRQKLHNNKNNFKITMTKSIQPYLLLLPLFVMVALLFGYPIYRIISGSFYRILLFSRTFILSAENRTLAMALTDYQSLYKTTWETQMAASVVSMIPTLIIFIFIQKFLIKGLISYSLKG